MCYYIGQLFRARITMATLPQYESLLLSQPREHMTHMEINRPEKMNAMNKAFGRYNLNFI